MGIFPAKSSFDSCAPRRRAGTTCYPVLGSEGLADRRIAQQVTIPKVHFNKYVACRIRPGISSRIRSSCAPQSRIDDGDTVGRQEVADIAQGLNRPLIGVCQAR
jgi:hypothetical protein